MRLVGDIELLKGRTSPFSTIASACHLMRESGHRVLAVMDGPEFRGVVSRDLAILAAPDATVKEITQTLVIEVSAKMPVREAAKLFVENDLDVVPVVEGDEFLGLLTANQLLVELGPSLDPMTGLSWSDRLRDWGIDALESGREVTIAFIDLNSFGDYNKRHGHIVGDRILRATAMRLSQATDDESDVLVRYGGDEFVIGTTRDRQRLVSDLEAVSQQLQVEGVAEPVTFSVGYSGGKRTREREKTHFASTLDNLINLASRDSLSKKVTSALPTATQAPEMVDRRVRVSVELESFGQGHLAIARLNQGEASVMASSAIPSEDAIQATCDAVCRALAKLRPETTCAHSDVVIYRRWDGQPVAIVRGTVAQGGEVVEFESTANSPVGVYSAVAEAWIEGFLKASVTLARKLMRQD